jgi:hypothetical protein
MNDFEMVEIGEEGPTCPVCCEPFHTITKPVYIIQPCNHDICTNCFEKLDNHCQITQLVLRCPYCRQTVLPPPAKVNEMDTKVFVASLNVTLTCFIADT